MNIKQSALLVLFIFLINHIRANTFYFSSSQGDDSRTSQEAQNEATPWKTLNKLNTYFTQLNPGDLVLFRKGDVFAGSLTITKSGTSGLPITFSSYGSGAQPVISGLTTLSGWSSSGNGIWQTGCSQCDPNINVVLINGEAKDVGRYPNKNDANKGYLILESHSGTSEITDNQLQSDPDWTGGEVVIRKKRWIIDKNPITKHQGNTITYASIPQNHEPSNDFGYFIQRHPLTLDQGGEWYFDKANKIIKAHFGNDNPANNTVKASVTNTLVTIKYFNNIVFDNIEFSGANVNAFEILDANNIQIKNCSITYSGKNGISASGTNQLIVQNNNVENTFNNAFVLGPDCINTQVINNKIRNTGLSAGMGDSGNETYQAIIVKGTNNLVAFNEIEHTGYMAIRFDGNATEIRNNFINDFDLVKDDGGGIYTYKAAESTLNTYDRKITGNIVLNGKGSSEGTDNPNNIHAAGIYIDDNSDNIEVTGNTVAFCSSGIYVHNSNKITVRGNTFHNNNKSQMLLVHDRNAVNNPIRNINVASNILFAKYATEVATNIESIKDDIPQFGRFDSNYYSRPISDNYIIQTTYEKDNDLVGQTHNLRSWQQAYGKDILSLEGSATIPPYVLNSLQGDNKYDNSTFNSGITGVSYYSPSDNCRVAWNNGGKLDGGALAITFNNKEEGKSSQIIVRLGGISSGKKYILQFRLLGTSTNRKLKTFLRNSFAPYNEVSDSKYTVINEGRTENEVLFSSFGDVANGCIVFEMEDANGALWLDNIKLYEANVSVTNPDDYIRFEYNATNQSKIISLGSSYKDVKGTVFNNEMTLQPYSSAILVKQSEVVLPMSVINFTANSTDPGTELKWVVHENDNMEFFEVERSSNGIDFSVIGRVNYQAVAGYTYLDKQPLPGNNYYRLKYFDKQGAYSYSKSILIKDIGQVNMQIYPVPVNNLLQVKVDGLKAGRRANLFIQNGNGATLLNKKVELSDKLLNVNVSSLKAGFYVVKIVSNDLIIQKSFIKQ